MVAARGAEPQLGVHGHQAAVQQPGWARFIGDGAGDLDPAMAADGNTCVASDLRGTGTHLQPNFLVACELALGHQLF